MAVSMTACGLYVEGTSDDAVTTRETNEVALDASAPDLELTPRRPHADVEGPPGKTCPEIVRGAKVADGHCYFTLASTASQSDAIDGCRDAGAHLVTITSAEEQDLVASIGDGDRWIGLLADPPTNDAGAFRWITNEPVSVAFWRSTEPNANTGCVAMDGRDHAWVDRACNARYTAVCERE